VSGQIFISYRRDDTPAWARLLYDRLLQQFSQNEIFMDVDMDLGVDFVKAIDESVGSCDVLIAVIGRRWLTSSDEEGRRRLDNSEDFLAACAGVAIAIVALTVVLSQLRDLSDATKEHPFVNSLGMRFVPVPGTNVLFSVLGNACERLPGLV
jgi:hypothetical protein